MIELLHKFFSSVGPFFLLLGLLIFVHELGHYLVAVYFGVRVETFSLGFGKKLFKWKRGETTYCISLVPLGGYVKMYGDDPSQEIPQDQKRFSFLHKPVWPRIAIVVAGPLMNLFFAIFVFGVVSMLGEEVPGPTLGDISASTPAYEAGFRSGDTIKSVNGEPVEQWRDIKELIEANADKTVTFSVEKNKSTSPISIVAVPAWTKNENLFSTKRQVGRIEGLSLDSAASVVGVSDPKSLAATSGLQTFDAIDSVNGTPVQYWRELEGALRAHLDGPTLNLKVHRQDDPKTAQESLHDISIPTETLRSISTDEGSLLASLGLERSELFLHTIKPGSPADKAGLKSGDRVLELDGQKVSAWQQVLDRIKGYKPTQGKIDFVISQSGSEKKLSITPEEIELPTEQGAMENRFAVGVIPGVMTMPNATFLQVTHNPITAAWRGMVQSVEWSKMIGMSFLRLIQNEVSAKNIGGVITIGRVASRSFEVGIVAFLKMMAVISINLFILNLLPIPVLDGGHLLFFTIEALRGAPLSFKKMEIAQQVGLVLLLTLMLFALFNDITHLISSW